MITVTPITPTTKPQALSAQAARTIGELVPLLTRPGSAEEKLQTVAQALADKSTYKTVDFMVLEGYGNEAPAPLLEVAIGVGCTQVP